MTLLFLRFLDILQDNMQYVIIITKLFDHCKDNSDKANPRGR